MKKKCSLGANEDAKEDDKEEDGIKKIDWPDINNLELVLRLEANERCV